MVQLALEFAREYCTPMFMYPIFRTVRIERNAPSGDLKIYSHCGEEVQDASPNHGRSGIHS